MRDLIEMFKPPPVEVLAARELNEARKALLSAQTAAEYADSMIAYHTARIERLMAFLKDTKP